MNDSLQHTIQTLLQSGWQANPILSKLINDYAAYHAVRVIIGGLFTVILLSFSVVFWMRFKKIPKTAQSKWTFEKKTYFSFGLLGSSVALFMAFVVVVNAVTTFNPLPGFSLLIDELTPSAPLHLAYNDWIQSGSPTPPTLIEQRIGQQVTFHAIRATVCGILLIVFTTLSVRLWATLIRKRNSSEATWKLEEKTFFVAGVALVTLSLLMMMMVVINLQRAVAPLTLTMFFG